MFESINLHEPLLVNSIGHGAGLVLFAALLVLFLRERRSYLPAGAASLALLWNLGSLIVLAGSSGLIPGSDLVATLSFAILSLLPAVLLHLSLEARPFWGSGAGGRGPGENPCASPSPRTAITFGLESGPEQHVTCAPRPLAPGPWPLDLPHGLASTLVGRREVPKFIWLTGYAVSAAAAALHLAEWTTPDTRFHLAAVWLIIAGFGLLAAATMFLTYQAGRRIAASMCLFLLAVSFVHFGGGHVRYAWSGEIALHHAGIPLALYVLLQDYRFLLLDTFLRFVVNSVVACGFVVLSFQLNAKYHILTAALENPFLLGVLLVATCLALAALIFARGKLQLLLTRVVFRRPDREPVLAKIRQAGITAGSERVFLEAVAPVAAAFVGAARWEVQTSGAAPDWSEAAIPMRFAKGDAATLFLGRRDGGRRYLSEDLQELSSLAATIVEQVERMRNSEIQRLVSQAELRALQSQINPHFLFNSLNTLYGAIPRSASEARKLVLNLAELFRYSLQSDRTFIPLSEELEIVSAYLQIETVRLGGKLKTEIVVDDSARSALIPKLSIQPLVENAVKHGVAARTTPGAVRLHARAVAEGVEIAVSDDGEGFARGAGAGAGGAGVGLDNVRQRLRLCFGESAGLHIESSERGSTVRFLVPSGVREGVAV